MVAAALLAQGVIFLETLSKQRESRGVTCLHGRG
jgi:hypothetical protein